MKLSEINTNLFKQLRFILVETSRASNIGTVARAMKTMGIALHKGKPAPIRLSCRD